MKNYISFFITSILLSGCGGGSSGVSQAQSKPIVVAALGDSITQAFFCDKEAGDIECFPRAVQSKAWPAKLASMNTNIHVSSYAIAGCTLSGCTSEHTLSAFLPSDYIVWMYGVNEAVQGVPSEMFIAQQRAAIALRPSVPHIIIKPPMHFPIADASTDASIRMLLPQYRAALDSLNGPGVVVIDPLGGRDWWCNLAKDQHPCEPAQDEIAKSVNSVIGKT